LAPSVELCNLLHRTGVRSSAADPVSGFLRAAAARVLVPPRSRPAPSVCPGRSLRATSLREATVKSCIDFTTLTLYRMQPAFLTIRRIHSVCGAGTGAGCTRLRSPHDSTGIPPFPPGSLRPAELLRKLTTNAGTARAPFLTGCRGLPVLLDNRTRRSVHKERSDIRSRPAGRQPGKSQKTAAPC
jgi:hypothetical protein